MDLSEMISRAEEMARVADAQKGIICALQSKLASVELTEPARRTLEYVKTLQLKALKIQEELEWRLRKLEEETGTESESPGAAEPGARGARHAA